MDEMRQRLRYHIDFEAIPTICQNGNGDAVSQLLQGGEALLSAVYNRIWQKFYPERPFTPEDFLCGYVEDGNNRMIYISLPANDIDSRMICTHMAITYQQAGNQITHVKVYHVEYGNTGTTAIGSMMTDENGTVAHMNYGPVCNSDEENASKIWDIAFHKSVAWERLHSYA